MKEDRSEGKKSKKIILSAIVTIGVSTFLFQGFTQMAVKDEMGKTDIIPTSYTVHADSLPNTVQNNLPEGYKKANYTIKPIDLEYYRNQKPTDKDMTKEDAAEVGAQALWEIFGLDLKGQVIEMGYHLPTENLPRSNWYADVLINGERSYYFCVDSVTGELFDIGYSRTLKENVSVSFDAVIDKNPQEYVTLAKDLAKKYNVVHGAVESAEYNGQGYSGNDPTISIDIIGENGEIALMTFSRYDKALLGIGYSSQYKYGLELQEKLLEQTKEKSEELKKSDSSKEEGNPLLEVIEW